VQSRIDALLPDFDETRFKAMPDEEISKLLDDSEDERRRSLFPLCVQFKNPAFEAEEEWRIGILQERVSSSIQIPLGAPWTDAICERALGRGGPPVEKGSRRTRASCRASSVGCGITTGQVRISRRQCRGPAFCGSVPAILKEQN
jgi:hypothetical protein